MKAVIDAHIVEYERYYKYICSNYYNGRYLADDLFQELYLGFIDCPTDVVEKFHNANKLNYLGSLIIRNIFGKRGYHAKNKGSKTSPLFELSNISELVSKTIESDDFARLNGIDIEELEKVMNDLYIKDWFTHDVFVLSQKESINALSKRTRINRKYLTDTYNNAQQYLRNKLEEI